MPSHAATHTKPRDKHALPAPRTLADRTDAMAGAMCRIAAERGACTEADLQAEGFTRGEIEMLGDDARDIAAERRRTAARRTVRA